MRTRFAPWSILFLLAALVSLAPAILYHDPVAKVPAGLERRIENEQRIFAALAVPPSVVAEMLGRDRTTYARHALTSTIPPGAPALSSSLVIEHAAAALPFWFVLLVSSWELARYSRRRMRESDARKIARFRLSDPV